MPFTTLLALVSVTLLASSCTNREPYTSYCGESDTPTGCPDMIQGERCGARPIYRRAADGTCHQDAGYLCVRYELAVSEGTIPLCSVNEAGEIEYARKLSGSWVGGESRWHLCKDGEEGAFAEQAERGCGQVAQP